MNKCINDSGKDRISTEKTQTNSLLDRFRKLDRSLCHVEPEVIDWSYYEGLMDQYSNIDAWPKLNEVAKETRWTFADVGKKCVIVVYGLSVVIVVTLRHIDQAGELEFSVEDAFDFEKCKNGLCRSQRYSSSLFMGPFNIDPICPIVWKQFQNLNFAIGDYECEMTLEIFSIIQEWALLKIPNA